MATEGQQLVGDVARGAISTAADFMGDQRSSGLAIRRARTSRIRGAPMNPVHERLLLQHDAPKVEPRMYDTPSRFTNSRRITGKTGRVLAYTAEPRRLQSSCGLSHGEHDLFTLGQFVQIHGLSLVKKWQQGGAHAGDAGSPGGTRRRPLQPLRGAVVQRIGVLGERPAELIRYESTVIALAALFAQNGSIPRFRWSSHSSLAAFSS